MAKSFDQQLQDRINELHQILSELSSVDANQSHAKEELDASTTLLRLRQRAQVAE